MKILLLNSSVDAEHKLVKVLHAAQMGVLLPTSDEEAWQMLQIHGASVELAIIHREKGVGQNNDGHLSLIARIQADPNQSDLPIILSSSYWNEEQFASHQASPQGVNAYLKWPFSWSDLRPVLEAMFGTRYPANPLENAESSVVFTRNIRSLAAADSEVAYGTESQIVLEDPTSVFASSEGSTGEISLEAHDSAVDAGAPLEVPISLEGVLPEVASEPSLSLEPSLAVAASQGGDGDIVLSNFEESPEQLSVESSVPSPERSPERSMEERVEEPSPSEPSPSTLSSLEISHSNIGLEPNELSVELSAPEPVEPAASLESVLLQSPSSGSPEPLPGEKTALITRENEERELADEMPYLFGGGKKPQLDPAMVFAQPLGDTVIPGGASQTPDEETLKKYLLLREQDVAVLSAQLAAAREQVASLEETVRQERAINAELNHTIEGYKQMVAEFETQQAAAAEGLQSEISDLRFQLKAKSDRARILECQVKETTSEIDRLKERVRADIRKIRVREKELENRLEIVKKDSEALISARENKIIELKRKVDLLEFNMDLLQDQYTREKDNSARLKDRLAKAAQVVRVAGGLLESEQGGLDESQADSHDRKQKNAS